MISTKDKIKSEAMSLFARKGYYGTSISDITDVVGIKKASFYSHYTSKDELFLAIFKDVAEKHGRLFEMLIESSMSMEIQDRLRHNFIEYILYFYRNPEIHAFSNISLLHVPLELGEKLRFEYLAWEKHYRKRLEEFFTEGMQQGIICEGDPRKKVWSFKTKRDGVLGWLRGSPELNEESVDEFWHDFWFGITERNAK